MKCSKRIPAMFLALVLAIGLAAPALAAERPTTDELRSYISLDLSAWTLDETLQPDLYYYDPAIGNVPGSVPSGIIRVKPDVTLRVSNTAPKDSGITVLLRLELYELRDQVLVTGEDALSSGEEPHDYYVRNVYYSDAVYGLRLGGKTSWLADETCREYGYTEIKPGESCSFKLDLPLSDGMILKLSAFPLWNGDESDWRKYWTLMIDSSASAGATEKETVSSWAKEEVTAARAAGLVPALTGDPNYRDAITREQFAELVVQLLRTVDPENTSDAMVQGSNFSDTENPAVLLAAAKGIVNGISPDRFAPTQTTNREQIAAMVARAIDVIEASRDIDLTPAAASIEGFTDKDQVSGWAVESVGLLAANGIMNGTSATTVSPKTSCSVEQSICLIYRVYQMIQAQN